MKNGMKFVMVFLLVAVVLSGVGCSRFFGPSDAEILKAIDDSGLLKGAGFTVTAPVVVLEKGKKDANGVWPVKVKLKLSTTLTNGQTKQLETTPIFKIFKAKDAQGKPIWKASL